MPDFGGDGVSLRGLAGQKLKEEQQKALEQFKQLLNSPIPLNEKLTKLEEKADGGKVGLWANINRRKKLGISRPKSKSTISKKAYSNMKKGFSKKANGGLISRGQGKAIKLKKTKRY